MPTTRYYILVIFVFLFSGISASLSGAITSTPPDTVNFIAVPSKADTLHLTKLRNIARDTLIVNPKAGKNLAIELRETALNEGFSIGVIWSNLILASYYDEAGDQFEEYLRLTEARKLAQAQGAQPELQIVYRRLAGVHLSTGEKEKALEYFEQALAIADLLDDTLGKASLKMNLAGALASIGEPEAAMEAFQTAAKIFRSKGNSRSLSMCLANMGRFELQLKKYDQALPHLEESLELITKRDIRDGGPYVNALLSHYYSLQNNQQKSLEYALDSYDAAELQGGNENISLAALDVSRCYERLGNAEKALEFARKSSDRNTPKDQNTTFEKIIDRESEFEEELATMKRNRQMLLDDMENQRQLSRQRIMVVCLGAVVLLLLSLLTFVIRQGRLRKRTTLQLRKEIVERKRSEHELNTFLYRSSHDLQGPLSSIKGVLEIAEKKSVTADTDQYLTMIRTKTDQLDGVLNKLVTSVAILDTRIQPISLSIKDFWLSVIPSLETIPFFKEVQLSYKTEGKSLWVQDPEILTVILKNLLDNSITFRDPDKADPQVNILFQHTDQSQILTVSDNGIGIREEIRTKVTNMFYQGSLRSRGNGLGLYLVEKLVRKLNGTLQFESEEGKGTTVRIEFPA